MIKVSREIFKMVVEDDPDPDTSYLEEEGYEERLSDYRAGRVHFVGVRARAEIVIPAAPGTGGGPDRRALPGGGLEGHGRRDRHARLRGGPHREDPVTAVAPPSRPAPPAAEEGKRGSRSGVFTRQDIPEAPGRNRISKMRHIARAPSPMCVEGHPVDPSQAQTVEAVYDALSGPAARHALMGPLDVSKVVEWSRRLASGTVVRDAGAGR